MSKKPFDVAADVLLGAVGQNAFVGQIMSKLLFIGECHIIASLLIISV